MPAYPFKDTCVCEAVCISFQQIKSASTALEIVQGKKKEKRKKKVSILRELTIC